MIWLVVLVSPLHAQKSDVELFQEAESRFRLREYSIALSRYDLLVSEYPRSSLISDVQFRRAVCFFRLGDQDEALSLFIKIEERYKSTQFIAFVPFWIGVIEYNKGDFDRAAASLRRYLEGGEPSLLGQARMYLAFCETNLGRFAAAIDIVEQLLAEAPEADYRAEALVFLASLCVKEGLYEKALVITDKSREAELDLSQVQRTRLYRAEAFWNLERFDEARELYNLLTDAPPEISSIAFQRLFVYYRKVGNDEELQQIVLDAETVLAGYGEILAEFWLRIGIENFMLNKPDLARSYFQRIWNMRDRIEISGIVPLYLSEIELAKGDRQEAMDYLQSFLAYSNDRRELVLYKIGTIHLQSGQWEQASTVFSRFLTEFGEADTYAEAAYQKAYASYRLKDISGAIDLIDGVLGTARGGALTSRFLLFKSILHKERGELRTAVGTLGEYLPLVPDDYRARMDFIKLYFRLGDFKRVIPEAEAVMKMGPFADAASPYSLLVRYMLGLAYISQMEYARAEETLSGVTLAQVQNADLLLIYPYILFYRGWTYYRSGDYPAAEVDFAALVDGAPDHELQARAAYLAGWCAYVQGRYNQAATYLLKMSAHADPPLQIKGDFMYAKTLFQQGKKNEAAILFENIYLQEPVSELSDDALYEYAGVMAALDQLDVGVEKYLELLEVFPLSPLAEEGMYRRGELLFAAGRYADARDAFYEYRIRFPSGTLYDAALYWGGLAAYESGEPFRAVLLWEKLIESHEESAFRADSLLRTAEVYEESGDFRKALNYYGELIALYPEEAKAASAELQSEKIRFLILGQGDREAELSAIISRNGPNTREGRAAMHELARVYIYKSGSKQNLAPELLDELISYVDADPEYAAKAYYLYGEYYYRKNELQKAAQSFLQTVVTYPDDRDLSAQALYKAAEMAVISGNRDDARKLVDRIESLFPSSPWVDEGRTLLGGNNG
ncbi:MAG: tetratricopeptide repeat protein [Spirochaetales bacterium]|nr:tetratricopeptide repeat protein [Spirochaetales bacterium]